MHEGRNRHFCSTLQDETVNIPLQADKDIIYDFLHFLRAEAQANIAVKSSSVKSDEFSPVWRNA